MLAERQNVTADASEVRNSPSTLVCNYAGPIRLLVRSDSQQGGGAEEGEKKTKGWLDRFSKSVPKPEISTAMNPVPVIFGNESSNKRKTTKEARGKHYFAEDRWLLSDDMTPVPVFSTLWLRALTVIPGRGSIFFFFFNAASVSGSG